LLAFQRVFEDNCRTQVRCNLIPVLQPQEALSHLASATRISAKRAVPASVICWMLPAFFARYCGRSEWPRADGRMKELISHWNADRMMHDRLATNR
jgi:hypothetical protein